MRRLIELNGNEILDVLKKHVESEYGVNVVDDMVIEWDMECAELIVHSIQFDVEEVE